MTKSDRSLLNNLYRSETFSALRRLCDDLVAAWHKDLPQGETEFQYMRQSIERDGKIMGLDRLIKTIEESSNQL